MNMKRLIPCFLIAGITFFSACEKGQMADMEKQGAELPEGKYPLTFTAVQAAPEGTPQTRVSENTDGMSSHWDGGEVINVQIADGKAGTYTLDEKGKTTAQTPCYWQNTDKATINAWYSNISEQNTETNTDKIVSLSNQSKGLAYVLKATVNDVSYNSQDIELKFRHQLAKVRVNLTGEKANGVTSVQVNNYTSCTVTNGNVSGKDEGYIQMPKNKDCYEASLVPMNNITANDFIRLNGNTQATINNITELKAGNVYTIEIDVKPAGPTPITPGETITEGEYIMTGTFTEGVTLNGDNINLIVEEANCTATTAIHVKGGTPTITVKGINNSFTCNNTPILLDPGANVIIKGSTSNLEDSKLTIRTSTDNAAGIGSASQSTCGDISIAYITLDVYGGTGTYGGAAIGTNGSFGSSCGNITIENSVVYAKGGTGAAAIGLACGSDSRSCGEIVIRYSKIYATTTYDDFYIGYAACIGHGAFAYNQPVTVGKITITTNESKEVFFGTDRFKAIDDSGKEVTTGFYKVGKCNISKYQSSQTWSGVYFGKEGEETELASGSSNGY